MSERVRIPVYFEVLGMHRVEVFQELDDGSFRRTGDEPLRPLRDNIVGIGPAAGELVSIQYDRTARIWRAPTVKAHGQRPRSVYEFLRGQIHRHKLFVFSKPSLNGRLVRFDLHELRLKPTVSTQVLSLLAKRYCEAIELWPDHTPAADEQRLIRA